MPDHDINAIVDDELTRQLSDAASDANVAAVFTLRTPEGVPFLSAAETESAVQEILGSVPPKSRALLGHLKVFGNVQSFALDGSPALVRQLLQRPEIASAIADRRSGSSMIPSP